MIIKELNLIGFGQFNNKAIELKDGLNIIYGENEAGKTTIHNFINGMFYGFLKPYAKRANYLEEHDKYAPWNSSRYGGIIKFTYNSKEYRIEREFTKSKEYTNVILEDTGEDITNIIDNGDGGRILQPGYHFFGFNDAVFSNTLSIKQLGNKTEASLANEVRDRLVNVSTTLDDNLSIEKATVRLTKSIKEIGSIRASTSPYGVKSQRLERLIRRRESILGQKEAYESLLIRKDKDDNELDRNTQELRELENRLKDANILAKHKLYLEAKSIEDTINTLDSTAKSHDKFKGLSMEDYSTGISLNSTIDNIDDKIKEAEDNLRVIENKIIGLESKSVKEDMTLSNIEADFSKYEELEEEKNRLKFTDNNNQIQFLQRDLNSNLSTKKSLNFKALISLSLMLGSFGLRSISENLVIGVVLGAILALYFIFKTKKVKSLLIRIEDELDEAENIENQRSKEIDSIDSFLKTILDKYQVSSKAELKRLYDKSQYNIINKEQLANDLRENKVKKEKTIQRIEELKKINKENRLKAEIILKNNASKDLEEFKVGLEKKNIYEDTLTEISSKTNLLKRILGENNLSSLKGEINQYEKNISTITEPLSIEELKEIISQKKDQINKKRVEIGRTEEQIKHLDKDISQLVEIDEEISRIEDFLQQSDEKIQAMELAKSTIENISKDIHGQFAPMINQKVGYIIEDITSGKYSSVKIDNTLGIGVINPDTQEIVDINSLSGGTIDQLYFALRFGIVDSINNEGLPLILDDCFIQYDDKRLMNIMDFLVKKSEERQIILFTCHQRENKILDEMKVDYNLINLSS